MKVAILYNRVFEFDGSCLAVGGIQTYLLKLAELVSDMGWEAVIFQLAAADFRREVGLVKIWGERGVPVSSSGEVLGRFLVNCAEEWIGSDSGMIVFGSDTFFVNSSVKSIAIQHGVFWDMPVAEMPDNVPVKLMKQPARYREKLCGLARWVRESRINKIRRAWISAESDLKEANRNIQSMVCVDYNYYNVYKAQGKPLRAGTWIIPNFADLVSSEELSSKKSGGTLKILFARRFHWYRGTRLIAPVFRRVITEFPNVRITLAGDGPDEKWLRDYFSDTDRVVFSKYEYHESKSVLLSHDIAIVASLGSEGTSLSAIEAMGAGCAVVATCVGGLTNVVIDGHNGKLAMPDEESLYGALSQVIVNDALRKRLAETAYETVRDAFSIELWRDKWRQVFTMVDENR